MAPRENLKTDPNGQVWKLCKGPSHQRPVWLHSSKFYRRGKSKKYPDRLRAWCKKCDNFTSSLGRRSANTWVWLDRYYWIFEELHQRLGFENAAKLIGVSVPQFYNYKTRYTKRVRKERMRRIILGLAEVRRRQACSPSEARNRRIRLKVQKWRLTTEGRSARVGRSPLTGGSAVNEQRAGNRDSTASTV